ncbi:MAG TPA: fluoride efflux transporter CrcB [Actinopolymorphaceae bacterium]|nr:fluoride efflux transporter CrcB [Actinopolymorphaceae bacterium]
MAETRTVAGTRATGLSARARRALRLVDTTAVIGMGGALGSLARYALSVRVPHGPRGFPWSTFLTNVGGCFAIGVLMVLIVDVWVAHRLLRPFLGVGVLGGFTTFSTYEVETATLLRDGPGATGLAYLVGTVATALLAVWLGAHVTRLAVRRAPRRSR